MAYVFAIVMPLVLLVAVRRRSAWRWAWRSAERSGAAPGVSGGQRRPQGEPGLGDPYYPEAGNSGYDVAKYQISVSWDPARPR